MIGRISKVRKRDGRMVAFDERKIADAVYKAACAVGNDDRFLAEELAGVVTLFLEKRFSGDVPGIEEIQDMVEQVLIETGHARMAKAYILYRERRARAREQVSVHGATAGGPLVGNPAKARVTEWSKARIADALVREADLDEKVAADVASRVEEKVFGSGVTRINTGAIRSLVETELLLMGYGDRVARQALVGLPRFDVDRVVRGVKGTGWRPSGPRDLKRTIADAMLGQYALSEVYGEEVVEAHLSARLHIIDVGSPFEWTGAVAHVAPTPDAEGWVEGAALRAGRLGELVTRELVLTGLAPEGLHWTVDGGPGSAVRAARRLLGHTALRTMDRRGGRMRMALALPALASTEGAAEVSEGLVREHWALFRQGHVEGLPEILLHLPVERLESAAGRRALMPALAAAAETGRIRLLFERDESPLLATPLFRTFVATQAGEAALPVAGSVAVNVGVLGAENGRRESAVLEALDGAVVTAVKALRQKRTFLGSLQADPSGPLYRVAAGARPLVNGGGGFDLVHLVGVRSAARRLATDPSDVVRLAGRLRSYAAVRIAEEGRKVRLKTLLAAERDGDAARRFAVADRQRFSDFTAYGDENIYQDEEPVQLPGDLAFGGAETSLEPVSGTLRIRFPREEAPPPEALYAAAGKFARDPRIHALLLSPWPDRSIQSSVPVLGET